MQNPRIAARCALIFTFALACAFQAFAQEGPFIIKSVEFHVQGRSLAFVLKQKIEADGPVIGRSFPDEAALDAYISDRRQVLLNNRVLASVAASRVVSPNAEGGSDVALSFAVVDSWNLVALPKPKYDSNKGFTLYIKAKDYNFVGSMQSLNLDLSFVSDTASNKSFEVSTSFGLPFQALGADWLLGISEDIQVWTDGTVKSGTSTGLSYLIPGLGFPANVTATQSLYYNYDAYRTDIPASDFDLWYLGESLGASASIPLNISIGSLGQIHYAPSLSIADNWWPGTDLKVFGRQGVGLSMSNGLSVGRVDWDGNMQKGTTIQISNGVGYNITSGNTNSTLSASLAEYANWDGKMGFLARLTSRAVVVGHSPGDNYTDLGAEMRGILDARPGELASNGIVGGVAGFYANLSVPVKLFDFPTHVLIKTDWLDFELQAQPFIDAGLVVPTWSEKPSRDWLWTSGGLELLFYPLKMRKFIIRASAGWDLQSVLATHSLTADSPRDGKSPFELFFGTGLAY